MARRLPPPCLALAAVATTLTLAACGSDRGGGAGDLTVTSRDAHPAATTPTTPAQTTHAALAASHAAASPVRFARVALRGTDHTVVVPRGWHAELWAHVSDARLEAWSPQGTLLVSSPVDGTVTELTPHHDAAPTTRTILSGLTNPQGLAFDHLDGREYLYVVDSDALDSYRWSSDGTPTHRTTTVADLPDTQPAGDDVHRLKNVVVGRDDTLYVDIGSSSNATIPAAVPRGTLPRASVIAVHLGAYFTYQKGPARAGVSVYATGVRNGDGLAIAPDGSLWTAVNERDQIPYPFDRSYGGDGDAYGQVISAYVDNHPPDEVARLTPGRNLGWPYCDPDPDTTAGATTTAFDYTNMAFTDDAVTNPHGDHLDCATLTPIQRGLPAHSAPLGMSFLNDSQLPGRWADGAVVAAHGSWDREPPRPPVVYWMPWEAKAHTLGPAIVLVSGFQEANGTRWGRLADAVAGPDGSLYVTDDQSGAVYRITP